MKESKDTLRQYVSDMLAVDHNIHEMVRRHRDDKQVQADSDAHQLLSRIESTFDTLIEELEQHLKQLGWCTVVAGKGSCRRHGRRTWQHV